MAADHPIPELDRRGLREFGLVTGAIVAGLFGVFFPWLLERAWPVWPWVIVAALWVPALLVPSWLKPVYRVWMRFGLLASRVTTPLILGIVFYMMISPIGLFMRAFSRDAMARSFDEDLASYRVQSKRKPSKNLEKPF
jgi:hypothetical protein